MNPAPLFEQLAETLAKEAEAHGHLLAAAQELNRAAKNGDTAGVKTLTAGIDGQIHLIEQLEEERKSTCAILVSATGMQGGNLRISQLIARAPEQIRTRLLDIRSRLKELIAAIAAMNATNLLLCNEGARIAREHLSLLLQPRTKFSGYRQGGTRAAPAFPSTTLINRTA